MVTTVNAGQAERLDPQVGNRLVAEPVQQRAERPAVAQPNLGRLLVQDFQTGEGGQLRRRLAEANVDQSLLGVEVGDRLKVDQLSALEDADADANLLDFRED